MDKALQIEIENEYKTQINELEENLVQIGEFEARVRPMKGLKMFYAVINTIFTTAFILVALGLFIIYGFFLADFVKIVSPYIQLEESLQNTDSILFLIEFGMLTIAGLLLFLGILLSIIRRRNRVIIKIAKIATEFKIRNVRMLDITKERLKNFSRAVIDNSKM